MGLFCTVSFAHPVDSPLRSLGSHVVPQFCICKAYKEASGHSSQRLEVDFIHKVTCVFVGFSSVGFHHQSRILEDFSLSGTHLAGEPHSINGLHGRSLKSDRILECGMTPRPSV